MNTRPTFQSVDTYTDLRLFFLSPSSIIACTWEALIEGKGSWWIRANAPSGGFKIFWTYGWGFGFSFVYNCCASSWQQTQNIFISVLLCRYPEYHASLILSAGCWSFSTIWSNGLWITLGINTKDIHTWPVSNDPNLKSHYKMYCKMLSKVIKEATIIIIIAKF